MTTIAVEAPETFVFQPQTLVRNWGMAVRDTLQKVKAGIGTKPETLSDEELMAAICGGSASSRQPQRTKCCRSPTCARRCFKQVARWPIRPAPRRGYSWA